MLVLALSASLLLAPQNPTSRPSRRPAAQPDDPQARLVEAHWPADAPGHQVIRRGRTSYKFLPIKGARYASAEGALESGRVRDQDLVIGLEIGALAFAFPVKMLGGPHREIINDEFAGVPFAVNW